jgi:hypothetical protein
MSSLVPELKISVNVYSFTILLISFTIIFLDCSHLLITLPFLQTFAG